MACAEFEQMLCNLMGYTGKAARLVTMCQVTICPPIPMQAVMTPPDNAITQNNK